MNFLLIGLVLGMFLMFVLIKLFATKPSHNSSIEQVAPEAELSTESAEESLAKSQDEQKKIVAAITAAVKYHIEG